MTVNSLAEFFKMGKGVELEVLTSATLSKLEEIKEKTATGGRPQSLLGSVGGRISIWGGGRPPDSGHLTLWHLCRFVSHHRDAQGSGLENRPAPLLPSAAQGRFLLGHLRTHRGRLWKPAGQRLRAPRTHTDKFTRHFGTHSRGGGLEAAWKSGLCMLKRARVCTCATVQQC